MDTPRASLFCTQFCSAHNCVLMRMLRSPVNARVVFATVVEHLPMGMLNGRRAGPIAMESNKAQT